MRLGDFLALLVRELTGVTRSDQLCGLAFSHALQRHEPSVQLAVLRRPVEHRFVDVECNVLDAFAHHFTQQLHGAVLVLGVAQVGSSKLQRVVRLQVGRPVRDHRVRERVRLVHLPSAHGVDGLPSCTRLFLSNALRRCSDLELLPVRVEEFLAHALGHCLADGGRFLPIELADLTHDGQRLLLVHRQAVSLRHVRLHQRVDRLVWLTVLALHVLLGHSTAEWTWTRQRRHCVNVHDGLEVDVAADCAQGVALELKDATHPALVEDVVGGWVVER